MRTLDTPVKQIRRKIFGEVAKLGFESTDDSLIHDIEAVPYNIVQERAQRFRYLYYDKLGRYQNMPLEHREIATSIAERNVEKARELSKGHARRLKEFIINAEDVISRI